MNLNPPSTLLIGPGGSGKTTSLVTLLEQGLRLRLLSTEPTAAGRIVIEARKRNIAIDRFHWHFVSPAVPAWSALQESAKLVNTISLEDIAKLRQGIAKGDGRQWIELINALAAFPQFGDVTEWGDDCAFAIDGLTGIGAMSRNLTVGLKPNPAPGEWGVMQGNILTLMQKLTADCKCFFILIAHVEREMNEITGSANLTVSTLGAKLAPKLPPLFTNVVYAKKVGEAFYWSTADQGVDTKNGDLPLGSTLVPSFKPIVEAYRANKAAQPPAHTTASQSAPTIPLQPGVDLPTRPAA
jgi:hypothetical protein